MNTQKQLWTLISKEINSQSKSIIIDGDEHHYAYHVLRLQENETVEVTNCQGTKSIGIITLANKKNIHIDIQSTSVHQKSTPEVNLCLAMPKPATLEEVVTSASELGADNIFIFRSEKTPTKSPIKLEKLQRLSEEATRISKSAFASQIVFNESLYKLYEQYIYPSISKKIVLFCDESHVYEGKIKNSILTYLKKEFTNEIEKICILIGPEASFSNSERNFINEKISCYNVSLGSNILRVPNAATSALAIALSFKNDRSL